MRTKNLLMGLLGCWLLLVVAPAFAQEEEERARPSWSEDVKKTEVPDAPEEQDRPQMEFSVDRSALQGDMPTFQRTPARSDTVEEPEADIAAPVEQEISVAEVAQDTPPPPVKAAELPDDERLVSLDQAPAQVAQNTSPAAIARSENAVFKLVRTKTQSPQYPRQALLNKQEGWVDLMVTVSSAGMVESVQVVAAEPRRVFERAAIRAARKWEFEPPTDSGLNDSQQGQFRVNFVMN